MYTYLASPYSSKAETPELKRKEMSQRFYLAMHALQWMSKQRLWAFSPIVHCHEMADRYTLPTDYHFWNEMNHAFIRPAESFTILCLPGWRDSKGVTGERQFATEIDKPIQFLVPGSEGGDGWYEMFTSEPKDF